MFEENSAEESHDYRDVIVIYIRLFSGVLSCLLSNIKRKAGVFNFLRFKESRFVEEACITKIVIHFSCSLKD